VDSAPESRPGSSAGLDDVDWSRWHHAYGPASDLPELLRQLASHDHSAALGRLYGTVCHQGTRWQASCRVVPFLVALVDDPATPDRAALIGLLRAVALGDREDTELPFDPEAAFAGADGVTDHQIAAVIAWLYHGADEPEVDQEAVVTVWERDCYRAAAAHVARFPVWVADSDPAVSAAAALLLPWFGDVPGAVAGLCAVPWTPGHETARACANLALGLLPGDDAAIEPLLTSLLGADAVPVRLTAAIALALRLGADLPAAGFDLLVWAADSFEELSAERFPLPLDRPLNGYVAIGLHRSGVSR
jgi:hypothetical protein